MSNEDSREVLWCELRSVAIDYKAHIFRGQPQNGPNMNETTCRAKLHSYSCCGPLSCSGPGDQDCVGLLL